jgi:hypothetical protein
VQADRIIAPHLPQHVPVPAGAVEEILAVDFQPVDRGTALQEVAVVRRPQAQPETGPAAPVRHAYLTGAAVLPPAFSQVPFGTNFHSLLSLSTLAWPEHA